MGIAMHGAGGGTCGCCQGAYFSQVPAMTTEPGGSSWPRVCAALTAQSTAWWYACRSVNKFHWSVRPSSGSQHSR